MPWSVGTARSTGGARTGSTPPSVFGRLLDPEAGHFRLAPIAAGLPGHRVERAYVADTLVLRTVHHTPEGSVAVTDALAAEFGARGHELGMNSPAVLLRVVEGLTGRVRMSLDFRPRPEYGLLTPYLHEQPDGGVLAAAGPVVLALHTGGCRRTSTGTGSGRSSRSPPGRWSASTWRTGRRTATPPARLDPVAALAETVQAWQAFRESHRYDGRYPEQVRHSATVLTGLTYARSGAVAAALTTSLPERIGGDRTTTTATPGCGTSR